MIPCGEAGSRPAGPRRIAAIGALGLIGAAALFVFAIACTKAQVKTGVEVGTLACKDVSALLDDGTLKAICATEGEIADLVAIALSEKSDAGSDAGLAQAAPCKPVGAACLTNAQIARGIAGVLEKRKATLLRDAAPGAG